MLRRKWSWSRDREPYEQENGDLVNGVVVLGELTEVVMKEESKVMRRRSWLLFMKEEVVYWRFYALDSVLCIESIVYIFCLRCIYTKVAIYVAPGKICINCFATVFVCYGNLCTRCKC